jgi:RNA polymerase sigma factor (sigma-70 family)
LSTKTENSLTDQQLVNRVLRGDSNAFSAIIKNTEALVAQIVFKMIANVEERKDIVQDIYLKAYKNLCDFRFQSKLSTWIAQISYNTCFNYLQKKKAILPGNLHHQDDSDEEKLEYLKTSSSALINISEHRIIQKELSKILTREIENLSPVYKTLITLYHNEEMTYEEIATITQLPAGTVKSYLFRARRSLKESILSKYKREEL